MTSSVAFPSGMHMVFEHGNAATLKRASRVLSVVKEEFETLGTILDGIKSSFRSVRKIDNVEVRGRTTNRKHRNVEILTLPSADLYIGRSDGNDLV